MPLLRDRHPNLVTPDLDLGETDGLDIAREVRRTNDVPTVAITGKGDVIDRVVGLEHGVDDHIAKPFHLREVLARIGTVCGGAAAPEPESAELMRDGLTLDLDRMEVRGRDGVSREMTTADIPLLRAFVAHPLRAPSRDRPVDPTRGDWSPLDRTIDNEVARLRKKIGRDPSDPQLIRTVRGVGHMLTERPETG